MKISIIVLGTMGTGIVSEIATKGHEVCLYDSFRFYRKCKDKLEKILNRLVEKERICSKEKNEILNRINFSKKLEDVKGSSFIIEIIIENLKIKQNVFNKIEDIVDEKCIMFLTLLLYLSLLLREFVSM